MPSFFLVPNTERRIDCKEKKIILKTDDSLGNIISYFCIAFNSYGNF